MKLDRGSYSIRVQSKFLTLIVPLVIWNFIAITKDVALSSFTEWPDWRQLPNLLIGLTAPPKLTPLYFLRDIFVCGLLFPIIAKLLRAAPWILMASLTLMAVFDLDGVLLLNSAIIVFYSLGVWLGSNRDRQIVEGPGSLRACAASLAVLVLIACRDFYPGIENLKPFDPALTEAIIIAQRYAGAILFWNAAKVLSRGRFSAPLTNLESIIFFIFCAHPLILGFFWMATNRIGLTGSRLSELLFFASSPVTSAAAAIVAATLLHLICPNCLRWLMAGKRLTGQQVRSLWGHAS